MNFDSASFRPIRELIIIRQLITGEKIKVGILAQERANGYSAYDADYLAKFGNLSPFKLKADTDLQIAPRQPFGGLHGVFADSLPDDWGLLLQNRPKPLFVFSFLYVKFKNIIRFCG